MPELETTLVYRVRILGIAREDARAYTSQIISDGRPDAAEKWLIGLVEATKKLSEHPNRFALIPEARLLGTAFRSFTYHSHRVIYWVDEAAKEVIVFRVYHGARKRLRNSDVKID